MEVTERADLASLIGEDAEEIVYRYAACDRRQFFSQVGGSEPINLRDRFTLNVVRPPPQLVADLMELTAANELDIMRHNPPVRLEHGRAIANLVVRAGEFLSEPARCSKRHPPSELDPQRRPISLLSLTFGALTCLPLRPPRADPRAAHGVDPERVARGT